MARKWLTSILSSTASPEFKAGHHSALDAETGKPANTSLLKLDIPYLNEHLHY